MPKASLSPRDAVSDKEQVVAKFKEYVFGTSADTTKAFSEIRSNHLLTVVDGKSYLTRPAHDSGGVESIGGLYSLEELFDLQIEKPEAVIQDLLYEGELMLLAGRPKVGKSRLVHQMTVSLSNGIPFLGMTVPRARRVLLVDLENKPWAIKDRLTRMADKKSANRNVFVWCSDTLAENAIDFSSEGTKELERILDRTQPDVLIIDPWRLWLGKDENDANEVVKGLKALTALRKNRPHLAIIVVHHVRKERFESPAKLMRDPSLWVENISGHYALVGHVDACYGLERQEQDGEEVVIFGGIARNVEPRTVLLNDDPDSLRFDVAATEDAAKIAMTEKEWKLWEKAQKKKQFTWSEFLSEADTKNKKAVSRMLKKAEAHGLLQKSERGYKLTAV
jgi:hypothetical protein